MAGGAMSGPSDERLISVFNTLERHIEARYGVPVILKDVPDPFTGDLDGTEIHVDYAEEVHSALFILVHLFGHTIQWNLSARARELSTLFFGDDKPELTPEAFAELEAFEREACEYSLALMHEAGITDMDQWVSDYWACDFAYLLHIYRTGEKRPFMSFWKPDQPLIRPKPIPPFTPQRWVARADGIVL